MKYFATLFAITVLLPICVCRKNLELHFEDTDTSVFDLKKVFPDLTRSRNEQRKFFTHEAADDEFSAAMIKKILNDDGESRPVIYPSEISVTTQAVTKVRTTETKKIPESLLIAMNDVRTADEFIRRFVASDPDDTYISSTDAAFVAGSAPSVLGRKGLSGGMSPMAPAEFAGCRPQKSVVKVAENAQTDGVLLWPPCVYLNRCGGCCASELMTCRPTAVSSVNVTVLQARYTGPQSNPFANEGLRVIAMDQHEKCSCGCKEQPEDCTPLQEYRKNECRCICANQYEATRCQQRPNKFWDSRECICKCRDPLDCSSGLFFSTKTCRCEMLRFSLMSRIGSVVAAGNETAEAPQKSQHIRCGKEENVQHR